LENGCPGAANELGVHGTRLPTFCDCVVAAKRRHSTQRIQRPYWSERVANIFSARAMPRIFLREPERYANHKDLVKRVLSGEAPADFSKLLTEYFRLTPDTWGKDVITAPMIGSQLQKTLPPSVDERCVCRFLLWLSGR